MVMLCTLGLTSSFSVIRINGDQVIRRGNEVVNTKRFIGDDLNAAIRVWI